jgi:SAM-dependent methyltransferase
MDAQYAAAYPNLYRNHWWWRVRERIVLDRIGRILRGVSDARILDVGCGAGLFFDALQQFGHVEGIESDSNAIEHSGPWRDRIFVGELDQSYVPPTPFDLILMLDVLEHVRCADRLVGRAAEILKPGGRLLITVPAFNWLWTAHDDFNHHVKRYTAGELRGLIGDAGLDVVETRYMFQSLVLPKLLVRAREAVSPVSPQIAEIPSPAVNRALQLWCRGEHLLLGRVPFGSSVIAVASVVPA